MTRRRRALQLLDTLVTDGDITRDQRNTLLMKCDNPHRRVFVEGAAEVRPPVGCVAACQGTCRGRPSDTRRACPVWRPCDRFPWVCEQVYWVDGDKAELLDTLKLLL